MIPLIFPPTCAHEGRPQWASEVSAWRLAPAGNVTFDESRPVGLLRQLMDASVRKVREGRDFKRPIRLPDVRLSASIEN